MADLKISQLTDGGDAQATDEFVVARSTDNRKITATDVAAAATKVGTLTSLTVAGTSTVQQALEKATISATAATGTINYDALTQAILYYTSNASGNWTLNVRGDGSTSLNTIMATNQTLTIVFAVTTGSTAYYQTAFQVDGNAVTPKWADGVAPVAGVPSAIEVYTVSIIKTGSAAFTALASKVSYK